jgi:hypothetical protein
MPGASNVIPTVPQFVTGDTSITKLQQLSYAVSFIIDCDIRPTWHMYKKSTQAIPGTTWTPIASGTIAYDCDGVGAGTPMIADIVTTGYYAVEMCTQIVCTSANWKFFTSFLLTAGTSNPHYTSGTTLIFGVRQQMTTDSASYDTANVSADITPWVCYPGDTIQPQVYVGTAMTMDYNQNETSGATGQQGRFSCNFTGYLVRTGT